MSTTSQNVLNVEDSSQTNLILKSDLNFKKMSFLFLEVSVGRQSNMKLI